MSFPGEPITMDLADAKDTDGNPLTDADVSATAITIYDEDASVVVTDTLDWIALETLWRYKYLSAGADPGEYRARLSITLLSGGEIARWATFTLEAEPSGPDLTFAGSVPGLCGAWITEDEVQMCSPDDFIPGRLARALTAAVELMYAATCWQFGGVCTDKVRPTGGADWPWGYTFPVLSDGSRWIPYGIDSLSGGLFGCGCTVEVCGCHIHSSVTLPGVPIVPGSVVVKVDGAVVDPSLYAVVGDRSVIRIDGGWWPCCQNVGLADTEEGTFSIEYGWGSMPPEAVLLGTEVLACELATSWANDGECRLPRRLTSIVREGVSMAVLDPMQFLDDGKFGLYETDAAVARFGCKSGADRPGRLLSPVEWNETVRTSPGSP